MSKGNISDNWELSAIRLDKSEGLWIFFSGYLP